MKGRTVYGALVLLWLLLFSVDAAAERQITSSSKESYHVSSEKNDGPAASVRSDIIGNENSTEEANGIINIQGGHDRGRWIRNRDQPLSIIECGAKSDVAIDNSEKISKCILLAPIILIPDGDFYVSDAGINIPSHRTIIFSKKARLISLPSHKAAYSIFNIKNASDIKILNPVIVGDKYTHLGRQGEWGMGVGIFGGKNIQIINANISKCWGDGIYIGHGLHASDNVLIKSSKLFDNRRQGISITSGKRVQIVDTEISNTRSDNTGVVPLRGGPHAGIDIEPNDFFNEVDVVIKNLKTKNNQGYGLLIVLNHLLEKQVGDKEVSITVSGHADRGSLGGLSVVGLHERSGKVLGNITFAKQRYENSKKSGVAIIGYSASLPTLVLRAPYIKDWASGMSAQLQDRAALSVYDVYGATNIGAVSVFSPVMELTTVGPVDGKMVLYAHTKYPLKEVNNVLVSDLRTIGVAKVYGVYDGAVRIKGKRVSRVDK